LLLVIDLHDRYAAVPWISNQILAATSVDTLEPEVRRVRRHDSGALKTAPLRLSAVQVTQRRSGATDLDLRGAVNHHLYGAFSALGAAAAGDHSLP
jgi:hypothetical protein